MKGFYLASIELKDALNTSFEIFNECQQGSDKDLFAFKEVGGRPDKVINLFHSMFPEGKVIFIVRKPEFIVRSGILRARKKNIKMNFKKIFREIKKADNIVRFILNEKHQAPHTIIHYEELSKDPSKERERLRDFLQIDISEKFYIPSVLGVNAVTKTSSKPTKMIFSNDIVDYTQDLKTADVIPFYAYYLRRTFKA